MKRKRRPIYRGDIFYIQPIKTNGHVTIAGYFSKNLKGMGTPESERKEVMIRGHYHRRLFRRRTAKAASRW